MPALELSCLTGSKENICAGCVLLRIKFHISVVITKDETFEILMSFFVRSKLCT